MRPTMPGAFYAIGRRIHEFVNGAMMSWRRDPPPRRGEHRMRGLPRVIGSCFKRGCTVALGATCFSALQGMVPKDPRFGAMTHFSKGWPIALTRTIAEGPLRFVRDEIPWASIEERKGKFVFPKELDAYMDQLAVCEISPLVVLAFENENYDRGQTPYSTSGINGYARYCAEVLTHYGRQIHEVEIWNEYNGSFCIGPASQKRDESYFKMLEAAYKAIKAARPDLTVLGGATSEVPLPYWEKLLAAGAAAYMDVVSVHPYRYELPPEGLEIEIENLRELVKKYNGGNEKPIWVSEIGWGSTEQNGSLSINEEIQAKFLVRAYALLLSARVERIYWYLLQDYQEFEMGLMRRDRRDTPKPAYLALKTMMKELEGKRFVQREPTADGFYSLLFSGSAGEDVRILWALRPTEISIKATGAKDMLGHPIDLAKGFSLSDVPVFVHGSLHGLEAVYRSAGSLIADSARDFSRVQGIAGWSYGFYDQGRFEQLSNFATTEWGQEWEGEMPFLAVSADSQHPSVKDGRAMPSVRRWTSQRDGRIGMSAEFYGGTGGDGVGVSICVDEKPIFRELLSRPNHFSKVFSSSQVVHKGTTIDFVVDPGPGSNIDFDSTTVSVRLRNEE